MLALINLILLRICFLDWTQQIAGQKEHRWRSIWVHKQTSLNLQAISGVKICHSCFVSKLVWYGIKDKDTIMTEGPIETFCLEKLLMYGNMSAELYHNNKRCQQRLEWAHPSVALQIPDWHLVSPHLFLSEALFPHPVDLDHFSYLLSCWPQPSTKPHPHLISFLFTMEWDP